MSVQSVKVIVPLQTASFNKVLPEVMHALQAGADMVEWRLDSHARTIDKEPPIAYEDGQSDQHKNPKNTPKVSQNSADPTKNLTAKQDTSKIEGFLQVARELAGSSVKPSQLLLTWRGVHDDGGHHLDLHLYRQILLELAKIIPGAYIDVELGTLYSLNKKPNEAASSQVQAEHQNQAKPKRFVEEIKALGANVVISLHDFHKTPSDQEILTTLKLMQSLGATVAKVAVMPVSEADVHRLKAIGKKAQQYLSIPHIVIAMGELGQESRLKPQEFGSWATFASLTKPSAPGQISLKQFLNRQ